MTLTKQNSFEHIAHVQTNTAAYQASVLHHVSPVLDGTVQILCPATDGVPAYFLKNLFAEDIYVPAENIPKTSDVEQSSTEFADIRVRQKLILQHCQRTAAHKQRAGVCSRSELVLSTAVAAKKQYFVVFG